MNEVRKMRFVIDCAIAEQVARIALGRCGTFGRDKI
jgi:hypothetical protein